MNEFGAIVLSYTIKLSTAMLSVAMVLTYLRLMRGPTLADRVVALDLFTSLLVGIIALYGIHTEQSIYLVPAIVLALLAFLSTVGFAYYLEKEKPHE